MEISYTLIRSARKTIAIQITPAGEVIVRCPKSMKEKQVRGFVEEKRGWIEKHLSALPPLPTAPPYTEEELHALARQLISVLSDRLTHFAPLVGVSFGRVTVRNQHTRWGSCSSKGNLNFNCLLALTPPEVIDYVVVHELCHRKYMNHSREFWAEVGRVIPDYDVHRKWLKENAAALMARLP